MPADASSLLAPDHRALYSDSLRPPPGYAFDGGVATTFSLDLNTLLTVPVYLALYSIPDAREALANPITILEAIERTSQRLTVFTQGGCMHAAEKLPRLCGLLDSMAIQVSAPRGGTFHPKLWLLRFKPQGDGDATPLLRLLVLSRNLTNDRSWDVVLRLEGEPGRRNVAANHPLAQLVGALPDLAIRPDSVSPSVKALTRELSEQALRTVWDLPEGFEEFDFETVGFGRRTFFPDSDRLAVISPFCDDPALEMLAESSRDPALLLSRAETLEAISPTVRARYGRICVLQDAAETEDGEESEEIGQRLFGLHAKVYVLEHGWYTTLIVGSGNATSPVFGRGKNVELFALLRGRRSKVGGVDSLLDAEGLGGLLVDYLAPENPVAGPTPEELEAEKALEDARAALTRADLKLLCVEDEGGSAADLPCSERVTKVQAHAWRMCLASGQPLSLTGIRSISVWPITSRKQQAQDGMPLTTGGTVNLGSFHLADLSGFVAFELAAAAADLSITFTLNVPVSGLPPNRDQAILRSVIENADGFLRYLRLLLGDLDSGPLPGQGDGAGSAPWSIAASDGALLEGLVRALSRDPERTLAVERLLERLEDPSADAPIVPEEFLTLWAAFRPLLPKRGDG